MTPRPLRLLSSLAVLRAFEEVRADCAAAADIALSVDFGPTNDILARLGTGEAADAAILTATAIEIMIGRGEMLAASRVDLAVSGIGLAVRHGAPLPAIDTPEAFREVLLDAPSIVVSRAGASGAVFAAVVARLGIGAEIAAKTRAIPVGLTAEVVARGEAALAVQQISELLAVPGVEFLGPVPEPLQVKALFSAAVFAASPVAAAAGRFLQCLKSALTEQRLRRHGLEPVAL